MGAGYPGDVTRTHPVDIFPELADATNPPTKAGQGVIVDATSHAIRKLITGDGVTTVGLYGITVRTFPFQQAQTGASSYDGKANYGAVGFGGDLLPVTPQLDVLRRGSIIVAVPAGQAPVKGGSVYIWNVADSGAHIQGGFEAVDGTTNTIDVSNAVWNSGVDANGFAELVFNI
jgi:hypothetical protein